MMVGWQQLTYASVEASRVRGGGWSVIDTTTTLLEQDRETLEQGIVTRLDEVTPTDEYAQRDELEGRDRRLTYRPTGGGGAWWHAVTAGKDATGRPGNVFTHAVLTDEAPRSLRPIELWRSPDWLTPFGASNVNDAKLGEFGRPGLHGEDWLTLARENAEATEALLSAVTSCFEQDRPLVMASAATDDFVAWLRVISHLTSHSIAWQIPFSTFVRASELAGLEAGFQIVGLPLADLPDALAMAERALVLDTTDLPTDRVGEGWVYAGQSWNAGQTWQDAFYSLTDLDDESIRVTLAEMDNLTPGLPVEFSLSPEWSLALAQLSCRGANYPEASGVVAEWRRLEPWQLPTVDEILAGLDLVAGQSDDDGLVVADIEAEVTVPTNAVSKRIPLIGVLEQVWMLRPNIGLELANELVGLSTSLPRELIAEIEKWRQHHSPRPSDIQVTEELAHD